MSSKTVEQGYYDWMSTGDLHEMTYHAAYLAGAAHGAAEEREACAQVCEDTVTFTEEHHNRDGLDPCGWCEGLETAAARIRQRGEK